MSTLHGHGVDAWPIDNHSTQGSPMLREIVIGTSRPHEKATVHLTPEQALYVHGRLSVIRSAIMNRPSGGFGHLGSAQLPADHANQLKTSGAKVWTMIGRHDADASQEVVTHVVIESAHSNGYGMVTLSPDEVVHIADRLTQITMAYLHENVWGGEDARAQ
jgi:hypothetical protein